MATWGEVADHFVTKMMGLFKEPAEGDREMILEEYVSHLMQYDVPVLDRAWSHLKLRKDPWWPTLGEVDAACRIFADPLPKHAPRVAPPSWSAMLDRPGGEAARSGGYAWEYICFVRDMGRIPTERETAKMAKVRGAFDRAMARLEEQVAENPEAKLWSVTVMKLVALGRAIRRRQDMLSSGPASGPRLITDQSAANEIPPL
jgi:hypothetical protein